MTNTKLTPRSCWSALSSPCISWRKLEIERTERFIEEQHLRLVDQGSGERDPLLLTAGELIGLALLHPGQLHEVDRALGASRAWLFATFFMRRPKATLSITFM